MSKAHATREVWRPESSEEKAAILRELDAILTSPQFRNSKRYPALLAYVVKSTLAGRSDELKERTLGVEVFDRQPAYDTNADTIVRYTAGEVRKRLLLYYSDGGENSNLRISLPAGSYVPEFALELDEAETAAHSAQSMKAPAQMAGAGAHAAAQAQEPQANPSGQSAEESAARAAAQPAVHSAAQATAPAAVPAAVEAAVETAVRAAVEADLSGPSQTGLRSRALWIGAAALLALALVASAVLWRSRALHSAAAIDQFWAPVFHDRNHRDGSNVLLCTGSVIFAQNNYSGPHTAGKDLDSSFVSMQIASAIAEVSDMTERSGSSVQLAPSVSTPLVNLRGHPVVLLGGYNNQWTMRLLDPLRFHFAPNQNRIPGQDAIVDRMEPANRWLRDRSLPDSSADDYAVVARFRNTTLDAWVVALAGLGRNGTEAAAQFATSPNLMETLRSRIGSGFEDKNIEVVLHVKVIDGKNGTPSILAVYSW